MLGVVLALSCAISLVILGDLRAHLQEVLAILVFWGAGVLAFGPTDRRPWAIFGTALLVRAILLLSPPVLSDDLYRYLWEGRAVALGENPYLYAPADPRWGPLDPIRAQVNHPTLSTIYPPLALWLFALLSSLAYHPLAVQAGMGLADALVAAALAWVLAGRGRNGAAAWLYALHPLAAVESASSGHLEPAALLCLVMAIGAVDRGQAGILWAGAGALLKLLPGALLLLLWRRAPLRLVLVAGMALATALPFLEAGPALLRGFRAYAEHWSFNAGGYRILEVVFGERARVVGVLAGGGLTLWAVRNRADPAVVALWVGGAFVLLSPTVHPWYIGWAWIPALICGVRAWSVLATLAPLSYAAWLSYDPVARTWQEPLWPALVAYGAFALVWTLESLFHLTTPGPWAPTPGPDPSPGRPTGKIGGGA